MVNDAENKSFETLRGRVLLAAGGTGGHIYPAVAVAEALAQLAPGVKVRFGCGERPVELQIYRRLEIEPWTVGIKHHRPGAVEQMKFMGKLFASMSRAGRSLKSWRPDVAVGFGSYVSVPWMLAARMKGAKLILHEQNVHPGMANRMLAPFARCIATGTPIDQGPLSGERTCFVGNPVRPSLLEWNDRKAAREFFGLSQQRPVLLVVGGSQGARGINEIVLDLLKRLGDPDSPATRWQVLWTTGAAHYERMQRACREMGINLDEHRINPYISEMARAYCAADVVLARAGALTLAELMALGKPSVLVPLPTSAGNHQWHNARWTCEQGAAEMIEEGPTNDGKKLEAWLGEWNDDPTRLSVMSEAARGLGRPEAARAMARRILEILPNRSG